MKIVGVSEKDLEFQKLYQRMQKVQQQQQQQQQMQNQQQNVTSPAPNGETLTSMTGRYKTSQPEPNLARRRLPTNWFQKQAVPGDLPWDLKEYFGVDGFVSGTSFGDGLDFGGGLIAMSPNPTLRNISRDQGRTGRGSGDSHGFPTTRSTSSLISALKKLSIVV
jgi:hypothetical protein